jgi:hypothetical protein
LDRKLQAERTAELLAGSTHPVVMLSYITNPPGSRDYKKIVNGGNVKVMLLWWMPSNPPTLSISGAPD